MSVSPEVGFTFNMAPLCTHTVFRALSNPHVLFLSNAEAERAKSTHLKILKFIICSWKVIINYNVLKYYIYYIIFNFLQHDEPFL